MPAVRWREQAINRLGGIFCAGLSFINGPNCPVPKEFLILEDINIAHRVSVGEANRRLRGESGPSHYKKVTQMKNPGKIYINLCVLCNQRMRHIAKEYAFVKFPTEKVIDLYKNKLWTLGQIAEKYDCSYPTVSHFLKRHGIIIRSGEGGRQTWKNNQIRNRLLTERRMRWFNDARIRRAKQMSAMYDEGDSLREVAQWFGVQKNVVVSHLKIIGEY